MSIQVIDNFDINVSKPLDNRLVVGPNSFYQTRHDIQWKYEGLRIWDLNDSQPYVYNGLTWSAEATATLQGPGTPSFIPKYSGTGNVSNSLANSVICELFDSVNTNILIGYTPPIVQSNNPQPTARLQVKGHIRTEFPYGFFGNGANLTNLNASNITQGSLNLARLSISSSSPNWILSRNASSAVWINPATSLTAATASALATTTSFWGQNYNGTQNVVGGDMTINGQISRVIRLNLLSGAVNQQTAKLARIEFGSGALVNKTIFVPSNAGVDTNSDTFALLETAQTFTKDQTVNANFTVNNTLRVNISNSQKLAVFSDHVLFGQQSFTLNTPSGPVSVPVASPRIKTGASTSEPSFTWNTDTDLGIYRPSANVMGFISAGVEKMRVNSTGVEIYSLYITDNLLIGSNGVIFKRVTAGTVGIRQNGTPPAIVRGSGFTAVANTSGDTPVITVTLTGAVGTDIIVVASMDGSVNWYKFRCAAEKVTSSSFKLVVAYEDGTGGAWPNTWSGTVNVSFTCFCI
jgi:hypothetical protein